MKSVYKKYLWEFLLVLSALAYSIEWWFFRELSSDWFSAFEIAFLKWFYSFIIFLWLFISAFNDNIKSIKKINIKNHILILIFWFFTILWNYLYWISIESTTVLISSIIIYASVFWVYLSSVILKFEKFNILKLLYIIVSFIWLVLVLLDSNLYFNLWIWEFCAFLISILFTLWVFFTKATKEISWILRLFFINLYAVLFFLIIIFLNWNNLEYFYKFFTLNWFLLWFFLAFFAWFLWRLFKEIWTNFVPASLVLIILLLDPVFSVVSAYYLAEEKATIINLAWMFIVLFMVYLISKKNDT